MPPASLPSSMIFAKSRAISVLKIMGCWKGGWNNTCCLKEKEDIYAQNKWESEVLHLINTNEKNEE